MLRVTSPLGPGCVKTRWRSDAASTALILTLPSGKIAGIRSVTLVKRPEGFLPAPSFIMTARTSDGHCLQQCANAGNRYHPLYVVGEHVERQLGCHFAQRPHQEVRDAVEEVEGVAVRPVSRRPSL